MYHAWYSAKASADLGSNFYLNEAGEEVEITCVASTQDYGDRLLWDDKVYLGQVTSTHVRKGQVGKYERSLTQLRDDGRSFGYRPFRRTGAY